MCEMDRYAHISSNIKRFNVENILHRTNPICGLYTISNVFEQEELCLTQAKAVQTQSEVMFNRFLALVYLVMSLGLAITAIVSSAVSSNEDFVRRIIFNPWLAFGLFMLQIVIVVALSGAVMRMSTGAAFLLFLFYSALTGLALSSIFIYYS